MVDLCCSSANTENLLRIHSGLANRLKETVQLQLVVWKEFGTLNAGVSPWSSLFSIQMVVEGVDGVHTMDFSSFECAGSFVQWKDYDYPWKTSDFMLAREARRHSQHPPVASSQAYPRCRDIVQFENPTRPPFLRGG